MKFAMPTVKQNRVIGMPMFFSLHAQAKSWQEVEDLLKRLRRDTREKYEAAYKEAGEHTSKTGQKAAVFIIGEHNSMGSGITFKFRMMSIDGLNSDALARFIEKLGPYQLIRSTIAF